MIGKPFAELGEIDALGVRRGARAQRARRRAAPPARHARRASRSSSGGRRTRSLLGAPATTACAAPCEATAYPLFGAADEMHGVVTVFWEGTRPTTAPSDAERGCGDAAGSLAAPGADTVRYGGNTSCVEVALASGHVLVLDAGTGMRPLGAAARPSTDVTSCTSCSPTCTSTTCRASGSSGRCSGPASTCTSGARASPVQSLAERIAIYLSPPLFPVRLADIPARLTFHDAPEEPTSRSARRRCAPPSVTHQGPTVGYRIEEDGRVARVPARPRAVARRATSADQPDRLDQRPRHRARRRRAVPRRAVRRRRVPAPRRVGSLGIERRRSSSREKADVGRLVLFHHDPYHTDDELEALLAEARRDSAGHRRRLGVPRPRGHEDRVPCRRHSPGARRDLRVSSERAGWVARADGSPHLQSFPPLALPRDRDPARLVVARPRPPTASPPSAARARSRRCCAHPSSGVTAARPPERGRTEAGDI